jgi:hypothetical protein
MEFNPNFTYILLYFNTLKIITEYTRFQFPSHQI